MEGLFIVYLVDSVRVKHFGIVRGDLGFDEFNFVLRQAVAPVKLGIGPLLVINEIRHKTIDRLECILCGFAQRYEKSNKPRTKKRYVIFCLLSAHKVPSNDVGFGARSARFSKYWFT